MSMFHFAFKNSGKKQLVRYLKHLRPTLGRLFGKHETYTPEQVIEAVDHAALPASDVRWGVCLYSSREEYDHWSSASAEPDYWTTRAELANLCFNGNYAFSALDVKFAVANLNKPDPSASGTSGNNYDGAMGFGQGGYQI